MIVEHLRLQREQEYKFFCRYRRTRIPYRLVKEEVLFTDPWVSRVYDVISDNEIEAIKNMSTSKVMASAQLFFRVPRLNLKSMLSEKDESFKFCEGGGG